jgi:hypothetical protein
MNTVQSPEQIRARAFDAVDVYLNRNATEPICFYDLKEHLYSAAGGFAKRLILDYRLVRERAGENSITDLTDAGHTVIKYGGIRKFLEVKDAIGMIRAENELLQNKLLKEQERNRLLEKDLKDAQYQLTHKQMADLKRKNRDEIIKIVVSAVVGFIFGIIAKKYF